MCFVVRYGPARLQSPVKRGKITHRASWRGPKKTGDLISPVLRGLWEVREAVPVFTGVICQLFPDAFTLVFDIEDYFQFERFCIGYLRLVALSHLFKADPPDVPCGGVICIE